MPWTNTLVYKGHFLNCGRKSFIAFDPDCTASRDYSKKKIFRNVEKSFIGLVLDYLAASSILFIGLEAFLKTHPVELVREPFQKG